MYRQRDSEGKLDKGLSLVIDHGLDVVEERWIVGEIVVECANDVFEGFGVAFEALGEVGCSPLGEKLRHRCSHHVIVVTWNTVCFTRKSISSGSIQTTGKCRPGNKVYRLPWGSEVVNMCKLKLLPARLVGIENCGVDCMRELICEVLGRNNRCVVFAVF
jgi:hypothetical protein